MRAEMSRRSFAFPSDYLGELAACDADLGDAAALRRRMQRDGYLLLRGFAARDAVLAIRAPHRRADSRRRVAGARQ